MAYDEFKYRVIMGILQLAGEGVSSFLSKPNYDEQQKLRSEYYEEVRQIIRQDNKGKAKIKIRPIEIEQDLTIEKIEKGNACLPCSRDHFSTISAVLNEALRFSRKTGVQDYEVQRRMGIALDEANSLERIDLAADQLVSLKGSEKQLAEWGLNKSRDLRHKLTQVQTHDELEKVAAEASEVRTEFMRKLWSTISVDGSISKLCKGLKEEEFQRCVNTINTILSDKQKIPP